MRILHQSIAMQDIIDAIPANAPYVQQELGQRMAQHHAKHVQRDSTLKNIWSVSIAKEENILTRCLTHVRYAPRVLFRKRSPSHALAAKPECMQIISSMFARFVLAARTQTHRGLSFANPVFPANTLRQNPSVVKTAVHHTIPILLRIRVWNVQLDYILKRKHGCVPRALRDRRQTSCKQTVFLAECQQCLREVLCWAVLFDDATHDCSSRPASWSIERSINKITC